MSNIEALQKRIKTTNDLRSIVGTMKSLSTASILQYDEASKSLVGYNETIRLGLHSAIKNGLWVRPFVPKTPPDKQKTVAIIIGSDNGLVGKFNRDIVAFAEKKLSENGILQENVSYIAVGKRISSLLARKKSNLVEAYAVSNSVKNISLIANSIMVKVDEIVHNVKAERVTVFYNEKPSRTAPFKNTAQTLLPFDKELFDALKKEPWAGGRLPLITIEENELVSCLIKEYVAISVVTAITNSLKAEHYTRLANMQAAEKNIDETLERMNLEYQQMRQEAITNELLDVVNGSEALRNRLKKKRS